MSNVQLMSVSYEELESGAPALNFCSEFTVPMSNKTFVKSFISFYDNDLRFKLAMLSANKLAFKWHSEEQGILEVYFQSHFMGYALCGDIYNALTHVYKAFLESQTTE